jgi:hypothetical protein
MSTPGGINTTNKTLIGVPEPLLKLINKGTTLSKKIKSLETIEHLEKADKNFNDQYYSTIKIKLTFPVTKRADISIKIIIPKKQKIKSEFENIKQEIANTLSQFSSSNNANIFDQEYVHIPQEEYENNINSIMGQSATVNQLSSSSSEC